MDVREPDEFGHGRIPGAVNILRIARARPLLVYCTVGGRSALAAAALQELQYDVTNLEHGFEGWKTAGYPAEQRDAARA